MTDTILYQAGRYDVRRERFGKKNGYAVYRHMGTHAERCVSIGFEGNEGLRRAIAEADRRHNEQKLGAANA